MHRVEIQDHQMLNLENSNFCVPAQEFFPTAPRLEKVNLVYSKEESDERIIQEVSIFDARNIVDASLDTNGFILRNLNTKIKNFLNLDEVENVYYDEISELIKKETGAKDIVVFNHTLRTGNESEQLEVKQKFTQCCILTPTRRIHNDYTDWSGPQEVCIRLPEQSENLLKRKFSIIHTWQPIKPIFSDPLAIVDAQSVAEEDLITKTYVSTDRTNQTYQMKFNQNHKWYYYPNMQPSEILLFKGYDSEKDGRTRFTPHGSFIDPNYTIDVPPRKSIEVRAFAFF